MASSQKNQRKYGRNKAHCQAYTAEHRHEKSHIKRIRRHLLRYGNDKVACKALLAYATQVSLNVTRSAEALIGSVSW